MRAVRGAKLVIAAMSISLMATALTVVNAASANLSHAYHGSSDLHEGSLVSLDQKKSDYVEATNSDNAVRLIGVVVKADDSLLAEGAGNGLIQVATDGTANALASTLNGDIKVGDQLAASPFNGVGMKAQPGSHVIGLARTAFNASSPGNDQDVTDSRGKTKRLHTGYIVVSIAVSVADNGSDSQNALQKLAKALTGHKVSTIRVLLSLLVAIATIITLITLIYGAIYGSIVSIGRNPLAKHAIFQSLMVVIGLVALTAGVATFIIILLLH